MVVEKNVRKTERFFDNHYICYLGIVIWSFFQKIGLGLVVIDGKIINGVGAVK